MESLVKSGEQAQDLQYKGLKILARPDRFGVSTDAVLLASFVPARPRDTVVDLGCGTGILSVLVHARTGATVIGVEQDTIAADMARRAAALNRQEGIAVHTLDLRDAPAALGHGCAGVVMANPPYFTAGDKSPSPGRAQARHEGEANLSQLLFAASRLLKNRGVFCCCYPADKLVTLCACLREVQLEPKRLRLVRPSPRKPPRLLLLQARKGAGPGLLIGEDLLLADQAGNPTQEVRRIYHMEEGS